MQNEELLSSLSLPVSFIRKESVPKPDKSIIFILEYSKRKDSLFY